jgi:diguanylate cyclase (GGDEF)-like protein
MDKPHTLARRFQPDGYAAERVGLRWMYALVVLPVLTDIVERSAWPASAREWLTEVVAGLVITLLVRRVRKEHRAALALARRDGLTGLWNRRAFEEAIEDECARARRSGQPLSLVYIDVDHFKQVNDRDGHARGDRVLRQLAAAIGDAARARIDRGYRVGGDEFAMLLPGSTSVQSETVVARIRAQCEHSDPAWAEGLLGISAGTVEFDGQEIAAAFVRRADAAMYARKTPRGS